MSILYSAPTGVVGGKVIAQPERTLVVPPTGHVPAGSTVAVNAVGQSYVVSPSVVAGVIGTGKPPAGTTWTNPSVVASTATASTGTSAFAFLGLTLMDWFIIIGVVLVVMVIAVLIFER